MIKKLITLIIIVTATVGILFYILENTFKYGLDIEGGSQLIYTADVSGLERTEINNRMNVLRNVIEARVDSLGVSEPSIYTSSSSALTGLQREHRLIVELPGVTDLEEAKKAIGQTPFLEFKIFNNEFQDTEINGGHITGAEVAFLQGPTGAFTSTPVVNLRFNSEGTRIFANLTRENIGRNLGIFLDGILVSNPVIQTSIPGGVTQITGSFTLEEARELSSSLNFGALPLDIELSGTNTVDPSLGKIVLEKSVSAFVFAVLLVMLMIILIYRLIGIIASVSLAIYIIFMLALFQVIPIVITAASLAGFIVSVGLAVDANILIFERIREELKVSKGSDFVGAVDRGFKRAWNSIRDSNTSSLLIALLLFWMGTSIVKGFAFTFAIGIIVSMITANLVTRVFLTVLSEPIKGKLKSIIMKYD